MNSLKILFIFVLVIFMNCSGENDENIQRPNILFAISDDHSWLHVGAYGYSEARTPHFDRIAAEGILFTQAFAPTPGCSPTRASILTGRYPWQIEHAGTHGSSFDPKYTVMPDRIEEAGYFVGYTGKGWWPGNLETHGWKENPAGPSYTSERNNYSAAFRQFLDDRPANQPFYFWYGSHEPHRSVMSQNEGSGVAAGYNLDNIEVPPFLPDTKEIRSDIADYLHMIEVFDNHLGDMLQMLEEAGELDNTIVIVTSDHGMSTWRSKANLYEYGIRVPLAIRGGPNVPRGRVIHDLINLIDLTATMYDISGAEKPKKYPISGRSLTNMIFSDQEGFVEPERDAVYLHRERHSTARYNNDGYPMRAVRTHDGYLYIRNFYPDRWPAGSPLKLTNDREQLREWGPGNAFSDVDNGPHKSFLLNNLDVYGKYVRLAVGKRPAEELYNVNEDPGSIKNLAGLPAYDEIRERLANQLEAYLRKTGDPRIIGEDPDIFESYPRYARIDPYPSPEEEPVEWEDAFKLGQGSFSNWENIYINPENWELQRDSDTVK